MASGDMFAAAPQRPNVGNRAVVMAHCDGGARGNPGPAGYGAVVVSEDGTKLAELSEFLGFRTNNFAEYSGLLGVLQWALDHGYANLRVVSDSELMVKQIQGRYKVNSPDLRPLFEEARRRIAKLDSFQITHALRHKNKDADRLANEAMDRGMGRPKPLSERKATPYPTPEERRSAGGAGGDSRTPAVAPRSSDWDRQTPSPASPASGEMLRGFVRDGVIHLLGGKTLPDGVFVKIVRE